MILCSLNPITQNLILFILASLLALLNLFPQLIFYQTFHSSTIHSLGFTFDSSLSLIPQIKSVAKSFFFHLCRIKQLKPFLDNPALKLIVSSLILSRFDYCNTLDYGLPETTLTLSPKLLIALLAQFLALINSPVQLLLLSLHTGCLLKKISFQSLHSHVLNKK